MNAQTAKLLKAKAEEIASMYSRPERANNFANETFEVDMIIPLSACSAVVVFLKNTGKKGMAHLIFIQAQKKWIYYFPKTEHFINLDKLVEIYTDVEEHNFPLNFKQND